MTDDRRELLDRARRLYAGGAGPSLREVAAELGGALTWDQIRRACRVEGWRVEGASRPPAVRLDLDAIKDDPASLALAVKAAIRQILNDTGGKASFKDLAAAADWLSARAAQEREAERDWSHGSPDDRDDLAWAIARCTGEEPESAMGVAPCRAERAIALMERGDDRAAQAEHERDAARAERDTLAIEVMHLRARVAEYEARDRRIAETVAVAMFDPDQLPAPASAPE